MLGHATVHCAPALWSLAVWFEMIVAGFVWKSGSTVAFVICCFMHLMVCSPHGHHSRLGRPAVTSPCHTEHVLVLCAPPLPSAPPDMPCEHCAPTKNTASYGRLFIQHCRLLIHIWHVLCNKWEPTTSSSHIMLLLLDLAVGLHYCLKPTAQQRHSSGCGLHHTAGWQDCTVCCCCLQCLLLLLQLSLDLLQQREAAR
jgi:hypothetical protein